MSDIVKRRPGAGNVGDPLLSTFIVETALIWLITLNTLTIDKTRKAITIMVTQDDYHISFKDLTSFTFPETDVILTLI